ncbi:Mycothiol acetyltransferase [Planctomycetes bacterium CA13]|uniref:Mycothiol acetyltransferase n=1 Tax=Novipirellula herctigrandis TaxID=2527986 RepID=A0A5C5YXK9_9BACT|nr:Mycothiol acetyltransferase [Planctomycetes bacterium CA13]
MPSPIQTRVVSLETLPELLPTFLQNLSIARGQIIVDQLHNMVDSGKADGIDLVVAYEERDGIEVDIAAAIAISFQGSDSATLLHATQFQSESPNANLIEAVRFHLDKLLTLRGMRFVQWASDVDDFSEAAELWREAMGFEWAADLDYLSVSIDPKSKRDSPQRIRLEPTRWLMGSMINEDDFARIVDQTYIDTLDCPALLNFRTAEQTIASYQQSGAFAPHLWFTLHRAEAPTDSADTPPIGVLVLAMHGTKVAELVYMGVVPAARGMSLGKEVIQSVIETVQTAGASRLILAVDQQNVYARRLYDAFGLKCMLRESVAVKNL